MEKSIAKFGRASICYACRWIKQKSSQFNKNKLSSGQSATSFNSHAKIGLIRKRKEHTSSTAVSNSSDSNSSPSKANFSDESNEFDHVPASSRSLLNTINSLTTSRNHWKRKFEMSERNFAKARKGNDAKRIKLATLKKRTEREEKEKETMKRRWTALKRARKLTQRDFAEISKLADNVPSRRNLVSFNKILLENYSVAPDNSVSLNAPCQFISAFIQRCRDAATGDSLNLFYDRQGHSFIPVVVNCDTGQTVFKVMVSFPSRTGISAQSVQNCLVLFAMRTDNATEKDAIERFAKPIIASLVEWERSQQVPAVRLFLSTDYKALCPLFGHSGASARHFCLYCDAVLDDLKLDSWPRRCLTADAVPPNAMIPLSRSLLGPLHVVLGLGSILLDLLERVFGKERRNEVLSGHGYKLDQYQGHSLNGNLTCKLVQATHFNPILDELNANANDDALSPVAVAAFKGCVIHMDSFVSFLYKTDFLSAQEIRNFDISSRHSLVFQYFRSKINLYYLLPANKRNKRIFTPKEHILLNHYHSFLALHGSVGLFSEQGFEGVHREVKNTAETSYPQLANKPGQQLQRAISQTLGYFL